MNQKRDLFILALITLITSLAWLFFDAYHNFTTSTITFDQSTAVRPVSGELDVDFINTLSRQRGG